MRIAFMGSGGLGLLRCSPLRRGCRVHLIARAPTFRPCAQMDCASKVGADPHPRVNATDDPREVGVVDFVMLCVKLWDTERRCIDPPVDRPWHGNHLSERRIEDQYREPHMRIARHGRGRLRHDDRRQAGNTPNRNDAAPVVWRIRWFPGRLGAGTWRPALRAASTLSCPKHPPRHLAEVCVFGRPVGDDHNDSQAHRSIARIHRRAFLLDVMREVVAVGACTAWTWLTTTPRRACDRPTRWRMTSSMHHDLDRGNPLEVRWLAGGVVELGQSKGVPTPLNRAIADILALHSAGKVV